MARIVSFRDHSFRAAILVEDQALKQLEHSIIYSAPRHKDVGFNKMMEQILGLDHGTLKTDTVKGASIGEGS